MSKKNKLYKKNFLLTCRFPLKIIYQIYTSALKAGDYICANMFNISHKKKQFFFSFFSLSLHAVYTMSVGVILSQYSKKFKFFKKSRHNLNPLIFRLLLKYRFFFSNIYLLENRNYTRKSFLFLSKLYQNKFVFVNYVLYSKSWNFSIKPVKRVKRRTLRLVRGV